MTNSILCSGRGSTGHPVLGMGVGGAKEDNVGGEVEWLERGQVGQGRAGKRTCRGWDLPVLGYLTVCVCVLRGKEESASASLEHKTILRKALCAGPIFYAMSF